MLKAINLMAIAGFGRTNEKKEVLTLLVGICNPDPTWFRICNPRYHKFTVVQKKILTMWVRTLEKNMAATYSPALWCSIIGHGGLTALFGMGRGAPPAISP